MRLTNKIILIERALLMAPLKERVESKFKANLIHMRDGMVCILISAGMVQFIFLELASWHCMEI